MERITLQAVEHDIEELLEKGSLTMSNLEEFNALSWARKNLADMPCEFWVVMNMLYSDYGKMLAKYNADKPEVYADMADAWLTDPDARGHKLGRYYRDIVAH